MIRRFDLMRSWLRKGVLTTRQMLAGDGLHMADAGYALLASEVAREIVSDTAPVGPTKSAAATSH